MHIYCTVFSTLRHLPLRTKEGIAVSVLSTRSAYPPQRICRSFRLSKKSFHHSEKKVKRKNGLCKYYKHKPFLIFEIHTSNLLFPLRCKGFTVFRRCALYRTHVRRRDRIDEMQLPFWQPASVSKIVL